MNTNRLKYGLRTSGSQHGDVFTSPEVVSYMLDKVNYSGDLNLRHVRITEPACGEGEFVVEIAKRIIHSSKQFNFDAQEAFQLNVRAYDIDPTKIEICRRRILELGITPSELNIQMGDSLRMPMEKTDIVIGNPPYIRYENIPYDMIDYCRYTFQTFHYRSDLYIPFYEKTLSIINPGGIHCFICSNRWLKNEYGKKLRQLIASKYHLCEIINLERTNAFQENVLAYPAITVIAANKPAKTFDYVDCPSVEDLTTIKSSPRRMPEDSDWSPAFNPICYNNHLYNIEQQGFKIGIGVATGADSIFISSELPQLVESELILPGINARDLRGDCFKWRGEYLLNPYKPDGSLINLDDYPRASAYLQSFREKLSSRHIAKNSPSLWYRTIDKINSNLVSQPKVLLPDMSGNSFIFVDDGNYYPLHNIYYITGRSSTELRILAALLMSKFVRDQLAAITNNMNGGFPRWQSQHLRKLQIPLIESITSDNRQEILFYYNHNDIAGLNQLIDTIIAKAS